MPVVMGSGKNADDSEVFLDIVFDGTKVLGTQLFHFIDKILIQLIQVNVLCDKELVDHKEDIPFHIWAIYFSHIVQRNQFDLLVRREVSEP